MEPTGKKSGTYVHGNAGCNAVCTVKGPGTESHVHDVPRLKDATEKDGAKVADLVEESHKIRNTALSYTFVIVEMKNLTNYDSSVNTLKGVTSANMVCKEATNEDEPT